MMAGNADSSNTLISGAARGERPGVLGATVAALGYLIYNYVL